MLEAKLSSLEEKMSTQHENVLFSPQAQNHGASLPRMGWWRDVLWWFLPDFHGEYPEGRLGPGNIDLFILQILSLEQETPVMRW